MRAVQLILLFFVAMLWLGVQAAQTETIAPDETIANINMADATEIK